MTKSKKELIEKGCWILGIDGLDDEEVIPLRVKNIKVCLKAIIEQSRKK